MGRRIEVVAVGADDQFRSLAKLAILEGRFRCETCSRVATRDVVFIAASLDDAKTKARIPEFVAEHKIAFPVG